MSNNDGSCMAQDQQNLHNTTDANRKNTTPSCSLLVYPCAG